MTSPACPALTARLRGRPRAARRIVGALALLALLTPSPGRAQGAAEADAVRLFADAAIDSRLIAAALPGAKVVTAASALEDACGPAAGAMPRAAWLKGPPQGVSRGRCADDPSASFVYVPIGYQAVAIVAPARAPVWPMTSADLFKALDRASGAAAAAPYWNEVSQNGPGLPAGVAVALGGGTTRLFLTRILGRGCADAYGAMACGPARLDAALTSTRPFATPAEWAAMAPVGEVAVVPSNILTRLPAGLRVLPLDGVLPTPEMITARRYAAVEPVGLMVILPHAASGAARVAARKLVFELLSEAAIGSEGRMAGEGLVAQPAAARLEARASAVGLFAP